MPRQSAPTFRDLTEAELNALLARNHVGRIAYSFRDRVERFRRAKPGTRGRAPGMTALSPAAARVRLARCR